MHKISYSKAVVFLSEGVSNKYVIIIMTITIILHNVH